MEKQVNLVIEKNEERKSLKKYSDEEIPTFKTKIELTKEAKDTLFDEIEAELSAIETEMKEDGIVEKCDSLDRQYDGEMADIPDMQFNVSRRTTAIKINAIVRAIMESFFEGDHIFSAKPRPEFEAEKDGREVAEKQEDFLDYKCDEVIPLEEEMCLVAHSAVLKGVGILKISMKHKRMKRKASECYEGKWEPVLNDSGQEVIDPETKKPKLKNEGLEAFLRAYPSAAEKYPAYIQALNEGKKLDLVVEYDEVVYDDPMPQYVDRKNFRVRRNCYGLDGLRDAYCVAEKKEYTYWELLQEEKEERLYDIEKLVTKDEKDWKDKSKPEKIEKYANQKYTLWEVVIQTKLPGEDEYTRSVIHVNREKKSVHGSDYYPYWGIDTYYLPFYVKKKKKTFDQPGLGEDLTDINLAQNMLLCFALQGAYMSNLITPIVKAGSKIAQQFKEKRFVHGMPLEVEGRQDMPDFLSKYMKGSNTQELLALGQVLGQEGGDVVGISDAWATGKADPLDPSAPAQKTRDLLQQAGVNVRDYVKRFAMSFNEIGNIFMQMYYQRGQAQVKYRFSPDKIAANQDGTPFGEISRAEMAAKTNFQTMALIFDVDKLNAKKEDLALLQVLRNEPVVNRNEESIYYLIRTITKNWSPKWRNNLNKIIPPLEVFKKQRLMVAAQAVKVYMDQLFMQAKATNVMPPIKPEQLIEVINQFLKESMTPPTKEELAAREKAQKAGVA